VIPTIITQLLSGSSGIRLGALEPTRDLVFVKDTVNGFIEIAGCDTLKGEEVNIATSSEISVGDLARKIIGMINPAAKVVADAQRLRPELSEVERLFGSNEKLMSNTSWKPKFTLDQGLEATIAWFRDPHNLSRYKAEIYNV
jgi:nucleoside-diphosphate-sugar epimerase